MGVGLYTYRQPITIDSTKIDSAQSNFPVRVPLRDTDFDFSHVESAQGLDIIFADSDGQTLLDFEKEFYGQTDPTYGSDFCNGGTASASEGTAANAFDNNTGTYWATAPGTLPKAVQYDLGSGVTKTARKIRIKPFRNVNGGYVNGFTLQGSNATSPTTDPTDDTDWTDVMSDNCADSDAWQEFTFSNATAYRHYRIKVTSNHRPSFQDAGIYEIELMELTSSGEDQAEFWVRLPSIPSTPDKTFYVYYGRTGDTDHQNPNGVWDSFYDAVWHLKESGLDGTADEVVDSTGNGHDANAVGTAPLSIDAVIYKGLQGQGSNSELNAPDHNDLDLTGDWTLEWKMRWITSVTNGSLFGKSQGGGGSPKWIINYGNLSGGAMAFHGGGATAAFTWAPSADTDYHCKMIRTGNTMRFFVDNVQVGGDQTFSATVPNTTQAFHFFTDGENWQWFSGVLDEVRLSNGTVRDNDHGKASYYSDSNQLLSFGSEEANPFSSVQLTPSLQWEAIADEPSLFTYNDLEVTAGPTSFFYNDLEVEGGLSSFFYDELDVPSQVEVAAALQWEAKILQKLFPSLQWEAMQQKQKNPSLSWKSSLYHKFVPNVVNYPFYFDSPTVKTSRVPMTISGCVVGYSTYLRNTGSSGTTTIEIYAEGVLKDTVTIPANGGVHNQIEYFDLDQMLNPQDTFEVRVTGVATGADDLKVNMYLMTFPFEMDVLFYSNIKDGIIFTGVNKDYLFDTADKWTVDFNQPILSVTHVTFTDENGDPVDATYQLTDGAFFNSRISITPYTTSVPQKIQLKIQDFNNRYHVFDLTPTHAPYMGNYPDYVSSVTTEFDLYIAATGYRYSFDGGTSWSNWEVTSNDNTVTIDFTGESIGQKTIKMQYLIGTETLEEDFSLYYVSGQIDAEVLWLNEFALLTYSDDVPLDRIELYYDDELVDTLAIPVITGFDTFSLDAVNKELDIAAGSINWGANKYDYDGSSWSLDNFDFETYNYATQYKAIFGFDTVENKFEVKFIADSDPSGIYVRERFPEFVRIWSVDFSVWTQGPNFNPYTVQASSSARYVFEDGRIEVDLDTSKDIKIRVIDVAGRTRDFEQEFFKVKYNIWRDLTVTKDNVQANYNDGVNLPSSVIDNNTSSFWSSEVAGPLPAWWWYEFGVDNKATVVEVSIMARFADANSHPKDFKIQGSNDGGVWTDLHTVTGETWTDDGPKVYSFSNTTAYAFYRIYITDTSGGSYVQLKEVELRSSISGADLTAFAQPEINPGEIHQADLLNFTLTSEDWGEDPDGPTE